MRSHGGDRGQPGVSKLIMPIIGAELGYTACKRFPLTSQRILELSVCSYDVKKLSR